MSVFQTVDTDFSPGDPSGLQVGDQAELLSFRPLTRISLLVTWDCQLPAIRAIGFRPLTRISLLVTLQRLRISSVFQLVSDR